MSEVVQGEVAGLGLGPPSLELFLSDTKEFRTPDRRPSWWDLGYMEMRPVKGGLSMFSTHKAPSLTSDACAKWTEGPELTRSLGKLAFLI